ncbi:hypothetical protein L5D93_06935 [Paenibacillus thiaminolyticus]|nr:hypothetical protein [Paenibacillus thiaminolyticus]
MNFGNVYGLQYVFMVTDLGIADTFDYKTNKGRTYRITNDFDFGTIIRLFEYEPGAGTPVPGLFVITAALQPNGFSLFSKLFSSKKTQ